MKLYYKTGWGWQVPGKQDKDAERFEVPTNVEGLCDWLNERGVRASECPPLDGDAPIVDAEPPAPAPKPAPMLTPRGQSALQEGRELDQFEEWIDRAHGWQLVRLVSMVTHRLSVLAKALA